MTKQIINEKRPMFLPHIPEDVFQFILLKQNEKRTNKSKNTSYAAVMCESIRRDPEFIKLHKK